jgi:hypothetical protein
MRLLVSRRNAMREASDSELSVSYLVNDHDIRLTPQAEQFLELREDNLIVFEARLKRQTFLVENTLNAGAELEASEASVALSRSLNADERLAVVALAEMATGEVGDQGSEVDTLLERACLLSSHGYVVVYFINCV